MRELKYIGEYGPEIVCFIPFVYYLKSLGEDVKVNTYKGMRDYYYFIPEEMYSERAEERCFWEEEKRDFLPEEVKTEHQFNYKTKWIPPPYNDVYGKTKVVLGDKPIFVIHNKYNIEWAIKPFNFLDKEKLKALFDKIQDEYTIVYIRPFSDDKIKQSGYSIDHNTFLDLEEFDWIKKDYPEVILFQDIVSSNYNLTKIKLYAQAEKILCVQGGNSYLGAYFDADVHVLHRRGEEKRVDSYNGWFTELNGKYKKKITVDYTDEQFYEWLDNINKTNTMKQINIQGWFNFDDIYDKIIDNASNGMHFVEVGSWLGRSSAYMGQIIKDSGKSIKFDCVDIWEYDVEYYKQFMDKHPKLYFDFLSNMKNHGVYDYVRAVKLPSLEASLLYEDNSLDFIFIDANHDYEFVRDDIKAWYPKLKPGGYIGGHDYIDFNSGRELGVKRAVDEFFGDAKFLGTKSSWLFQK